MKAHLPALLIAVPALIGVAADAHAQTPDVSGFEFAIRETQPLGQEQPADPQIILTIITDENFCGWSLPAQVKLTSDSVGLDVSDPTPPPLGTGCIPEGSPAEFDMPLDLTTGDYTVSFNWHGMTDTYDLVVNDEYTQLTAKHAIFTSAHFSEMFGPYSLQATYGVSGSSRWYRFPSDSFIVTCGGLTGDEQFCTDFFAQIQSLPVAPVDLPSDGIWPFPTENNGNYYNAPTRLYKYDSDAVWDAAKQKLSVYVNGVFSTCGRSIALQNWRHDFADSWLIRDTGCDYPYSGTPSPPVAIEARSASPTLSPASLSAQVNRGPSSRGHNSLFWVIGAIGIAMAAGIVTLVWVRRRSPR